MENPVDNSGATLADRARLQANARTCRDLAASREERGDPGSGAVLTLAAAVYELAAISARAASASA